MPRPRLKLVELHCTSLGMSRDVSTCEDFAISAVLEDEAGSIHQHHRNLLVYPKIMADAEQFPWMVAEALRSIMIADDH